MSVPKTATVVRSASSAPGFHHLVCRAAEPFDHRPGQYVIMHSDLPHPEKEGQVLKKAYSIASAPDPARTGHIEFEVAEVGPMSAFLADRQPGDELRFSGPWGKEFFLDLEDTGPVIAFATGSGFSPIRAIVDAFLASERPEAVHLAWQIAAPHHPAVLEAWARDVRFTGDVGDDLADAVPVEPHATYFLAGDGTVLDALAARLEAGGVPPAQIRKEAFFR